LYFMQIGHARLSIAKFVLFLVLKDAKGAPPFLKKMDPF